MQFVDSEVDNVYLWKIGSVAPADFFSYADTWLELHPITDQVAWSDSIWFKGRIPKHAFIDWVSARNRLLTRDRLRSWEMLVPSICLLCNSQDESRQHLFFDFPFSFEFWFFFSSRAYLSPPLGFEDLLRWMKDPSRNSMHCSNHEVSLLSFALLIWKERNNRLHSSSSRPAQSSSRRYSRLFGTA
ncbi:hypothetical protein V5N11_018517 [Cardamine amara subsp. amara]|uniref:Reverse transcriptase zinc-binding domain-containing protein n=1 Tax=Cardamine amara subsp. amara TaxID=228776 RepID=A0ABD0ZEQ0_CARAN